MTPLSQDQREYIASKIQRGEELTRDDEYLLFPPDRRECTLTYGGKKSEGDILAETMGVPLQPVRTFLATEAERDWQNLLIFGDNIQAMKTLLTMKKEGKLKNADGTNGVRLVYIDPPFASQQEFSANQDQKAYRDRIIGAEFLEFLRERLIMIRELLASDGSLFVHLDQRKVHYVKVVLDEVFTENNFRNEIVLPGRASKNLQQQFETINRLNVRHDTLLWYSKSGDTKFSKHWIQKHNAGNPEGHWHHAWSTADRRTMRYPLFGITPQTGQWVWGEQTAQQAVENYERYLEEGGGRSLAEYWRDTGAVLRFIRRNPDDGSPQYWRAPAKDRLADTMWAGIPIYSSQTKYPTEKNEALLQQVIDLASNKGDLVLDAFAGSGTMPATAEKLSRRWIAIDSGKLAIYTIQKRLLTLRAEIGNKGPHLTAKPFTLCNAGLYDFPSLRQLPWPDWRFFALQLFECRDEPHVINGLHLDGKRRGASVLVFNHHARPGQMIDEGFVQDLHSGYLCPTPKNVVLSKQY